MPYNPPYDTGQCVQYKIYSIIPSDLTRAMFNWFSLTACVVKSLSRYFVGQNIGGKMIVIFEVNTTNGHYIQRQIVNTSVIYTTLGMRLSIINWVSIHIHQYIDDTSFIPSPRIR